MKLYEFQVTQDFNCTYSVEADSPEEAWEELMDGNGECVDQSPGEIASTFEESYYETVEV